MLIRNGIVVDVESGASERADVLVEDGVIAAVGAGLDAPRTGEVVDATGMIVLPGFVDTHRHTWQADLRGILPTGTLEEYVRRVLGEAASRYGPQEVHSGTLSGARECLESGITTLLDWTQLHPTPEHSDAALDALGQSGIRAVFAYPPGDAAEAARLRDRTGGLVTMAAAALGPDFAGEEEAAREVRVALDLDLPVSVHLRGDAGLELFEPVASRTTYIHGVRMTEDGFKRIADTGGALSLSPFSEVKLRMGTPPVARARAAGVRTALGGDSVTCGPGDMFSLMRGLYLMDPALTPIDVLRMATIEGARTVGLGEVAGSVRQGKQADLVLLRIDRPGEDPVTTVVLDADRRAVDTVLVAGEVVKRAGAA
ncbi:amidohydrolase family protein [Thermoactinospora rubra]|uniref:amidohydrolase family protein n=1 Tax=Thermoactinospora rubra TaxID=1088767 RepID=UPI000A1034FC|nr:amidohydrolase family protein [Thermoactinospora rubra]